MFHLHSVILHHLEWVYQKGPKSDVNIYIYIYQSVQWEGKLTDSIS